MPNSKIQMTTVKKSKELITKTRKDEGTKGKNTFSLFRVFPISCFRDNLLCLTPCALLLTPLFPSFHHSIIPWFQLPNIPTLLGLYCLPPCISLTLARSGDPSSRTGKFSTNSTYWGLLYRAIRSPTKSMRAWGSKC